MASKAVKKRQSLSASSEAIQTVRSASSEKSAASTVCFTLPKDSVSASETWQRV